MNKAIETAAKYLAGVGALNIGLSKFLNVDLLSYVPDGVFRTVAVVAVAVSGGFIILWAWKKRI